MKETRSWHCLRAACARSACTLFAPGSSPRNTRTADVSRTKRLLAAIFVLTVLPPFFQKPIHSAFLPRTPKCRNRICRDRDNSGRGAFHHPFHSRIRTNWKLLSNSGRDGDLSPLRYFGTHDNQDTRKYVTLQDVNESACNLVKNMRRDNPVSKMLWRKFDTAGLCQVF